MSVILSFQMRLRALGYRKYLPTLLSLLDPRKQDVILDVGAGTGYISSIVAGLCDDLYALDPNTERVEYIKKKFPQVKAFEGYSEHVPFPDSYFDKAYAISSFHHFEDQHEALEELRRIIKPKGLVLIHDADPKNATAGQTFESKMLKEKIRFVEVEELKQMAEQHDIFTKSIKVVKNGYFFAASNEKEMP